ncbi:MAG: hypothetical protein ACFFCO_07945 [Promethearchaeota archaeon]
MPGGFRDIREYDDGGEEEKHTRRERAKEILKAYERFHEAIEAARHANKENPQSPEEARESQARIEAILAEASRQAEENITPPTERLVEQQAPLVPPRELSLQERRIMPQDSANPDTNEHPEYPVDTQRPKPELREQIFALPQRESEHYSIRDAANSRVWKSIDSVEEYQQVLRAFPDETASSRFADLDCQVKAFFNMRRHFPEGGPVEFIAEVTGIPTDVVQKWVDGVERPEFLLKLERRAAKTTDLKTRSPGEERTSQSSSKESSERGRTPPSFSDMPRNSPESITREQLQEDFRRYDLTDAESPILRTADTPELRKTLFPPPGSQLTNVVGDLLSLVENAPDPASLTLISDYETYLKALQAFPLVQLNPRFDEWHRVVKLYFQFHSLRASGPKISRSIFKEYTGLSDETHNNWLEGKPPRLVGKLQRRAKYITELRSVGYFKEAFPINTIDELKQRLDTFALRHHIINHPKYSQWIESSERHLLVMRLVKAGHYFTELSYYPVGEWVQEFRFRKAVEHQPNLVRLVTQIPDTPPDLGYYWLPISSHPNPRYYEFSDWVQVPLRITSQDQLDKVLTHLLVPTPERLGVFDMNPEILSEWERKFGSICTLEEKRLAFGYLIGITLSDGGVYQHKTLLSRHFSIRLSSRMRSGEPAPWNKDIGNRTAYYWTRLGIPTKREKDILKGERGAIHRTYEWRSGHSPFLAWFHEGVLCLPPEGNHTDHLSKATWICQTDRDFRIKVLQGLNDGDGWVLLLSDSLFGIAAQRQGPLIETLLQSLGFNPRRSGLTTARNGMTCFDPVIADKQQLQSLSELPAFLSAKGKQALLEKAVRMNASTRSPSMKSSGFQDLPLTRYILERARELPKEERIGRIRLEVFDRVGVTLGRHTIRDVIKQGKERIIIDEKIVEAYVMMLKLRLTSPNESIRLLCHKVLKETGVIRTRQTWGEYVRGTQVPIHVKRAVSDNHPLIDEELLEAYPHLKRFKSLLKV